MKNLVLFLLGSAARSRYLRLPSHRPSMRNRNKFLSVLAGAIPTASFFLLSSMAANVAAAQQTCGPRGSDPTCPDYVVVVPSKATDGSVDIPPNVSTTLFGGITPPNGFIVQSVEFGDVCWVNDNGAVASGTGFAILPGGPAFVTPLGYKPMGPVSIFCSGGVREHGIQVEARAW